MNDTLGPVLFVGFIVFIWSFSVFTTGYDAGAYYQTLKEREKFIIFCTDKGISFENCDNIFYGKKVSVDTKPAL